MKALTPQTYYFKDDGFIPNSLYPVLIYRNVFASCNSNYIVSVADQSACDQRAADWLEKRFAGNGWTNSWRWGIYPYHHYHSNTHEVLGVFRGSALLQLGGELGALVNVNMGDVLILPAGTGHKCISAKDDFEVLGAYPEGVTPDLRKGRKDEKAKADASIAQVPLPKLDPVTGTQSGLRYIWLR